MKKLFSHSYIYLFLYFLIFSFGCGSQKANQQGNQSAQPNTTNPQNQTMSNLNDENHLAEWKVIDSLEQSGLPKSALEKLNELYEIVKKEDNPSQIIKCLIYRGKYESQLEEDGLVNALYKMQNEMDTAEFPVKPILQSMLAEMYSRYLGNNYWRFEDRTQVRNFDNADIRTWTIEQLVAKTRDLYFSSVQYEAAKKEALSNFNTILAGNDVYQEFRPTLYDFLVHRALDYLSSENSYLTEPAYKFLY